MITYLKTECFYLALLSQFQASREKALVPRKKKKWDTRAFCWIFPRYALSLTIFVRFI